MRQNAFEIADRNVPYNTDKPRFLKKNETLPKITEKSCPTLTTRATNTESNKANQLRITEDKIIQTTKLDLMCSNANVELTKADLLRVAEEERLSNEKIKPCPLCKKPIYLIDGCNNMKCWESDPPSNCPMEFCFQCLLPKFRPYSGLEHLGFCQKDHPTHNSH